MPVWTASDSADAEDAELSLGILASAAGPSEHINQLSEAVLGLAQTLMPDDGEGVDLSFLAAEQVQGLAARGWKDFKAEILKSGRDFVVDPALLNGTAVVTDADAASGTADQQEQANDVMARPREWHVSWCRNVARWSSCFRKTLPLPLQNVKPLFSQSVCSSWLALDSLPHHHRQARFSPQ